MLGLPLGLTAIKHERITNPGAVHFGALCFGLPGRGLQPLKATVVLSVLLLLHVVLVLILEAAAAIVVAYSPPTAPRNAQQNNSFAVNALKLL